MLTSAHGVLALLLVCLFNSTHGEVFFEETFDGKLEDRWVQSTKKSDYGKVTLSHGKIYGDSKINVGLTTTEDSRFYATSAPLTRAFNNHGRKLVLSFTVKHEQMIECGGGYIKVFPEAKLEDFSGDTEYNIMFGPDVCGPTKRIHLIFHYKGRNLLWKKTPVCPMNRLTHVYTLILNPDNTYAVEVDGVQKEGGRLEDDWDFLPPKQIPDPSDKKPADWVDEMMMDDADDKKPEDWDLEPATIPDTSAKRPEDWKEEEDGVWEPPHRANPKYKGPWTPKKVRNPNYKGPWVARTIPNPEYAPDETLYKLHKPIAAVGFDLWQVNAGSVFDNIILSDSVEEVKAFIARTWGATHEAEKVMLERLEKEESTKEPKKDDDYEATKRMYEQVSEDEEL